MQSMGDPDQSNKYGIIWSTGENDRGEGKIHGS
jgi:hypothetical protein